MRNQDFIDEGCEDYLGEFGGKVAGFVFVPEVEKADPAPRLWSGWEYPGEGSMGEDHMSPSERKAWEASIAWEHWNPPGSFSDDIWDSKWDWWCNQPMWVPAY